MTDDLPLFSEASGYQPEPEPQLKGDNSLSAAINAWAESLETAGKSIHTIKAFSGDLRLLAQFIGAGTSINAIGIHDLKNFLDWMLNKRNVPCSPKTYARRVTSLKSFFRWLVQAGVLDENPADAIPQQTVLSPLPAVLSPQRRTRPRKIPVRSAREITDPACSRWTITRNPAYWVESGRLTAGARSRLPSAEMTRRLDVTPAPGDGAPR